MFNIQGFYKIKSVVNCSLYKEEIKKYLFEQDVKDEYDCKCNLTNLE